MDRLEKLLFERTYNEILLDQSSDSGVALEFRGRSRESIEAEIKDLESKKIPLKLDKWDYAPEEDKVKRQTAEDVHFELYRKLSEIRNDEAMDFYEKQNLRRALYKQIDDLGFDLNEDPSDYNVSEYELALAKWEEEIKLFEEERSRIEILKWVLSNLQSFEQGEILLQLISIEVENEDLGFGTIYKEFPFLSITEGVINQIIELDIINSRGAREKVRELLGRIGEGDFNDVAYNAFINHIKGHKVIREILFREAANSGQVIEFPKLIIPIKGLPNSLPSHLIENYDNVYLSKQHIIVWRYPRDVISSGHNIRSEADGEVIFNGKVEDFHYETGVEENAHAFYFMEAQRDLSSQENLYRQNVIKYHAKKPELNALYAILAAYIVKYGSEANIPKETYDTLMNLIIESAKANA